MTTAYKVFTHDLRPPVQGGDLVWDGTLPHTLPIVSVDTSDRECAAGWNACSDPVTALKIAGLWPNGRPCRMFHVETDGTVITRGNKLRAATWTITQEQDVLDGPLQEFSKKYFGELAEEMYAQQREWYIALGRPYYDRGRVEQGLQNALETRGLEWKLQKYPTVWAARDAWSVWDARTTWDAWAIRDSWDAWTAWAARDAWTAWADRATFDAWVPRDAWAARDARDWDARNAWTALTIYYTKRRGWIGGDPLALTTGLRDAYAHGLALAIPVEKNTLGWTMKLEP